MVHLKDKGTADRFHFYFTNRFHALQELYGDNSTDLEAKWERAKQMQTSPCEEVVGRKTAPREEWITYSLSTEDQN